MISAHEAEVTFRFDALHWRFKDSLGPDDYRLVGVLDAIGPVDGRRVLDLGCGKGRFAKALWERGAEVTGIDPSSAMLAGAEGVDRVLGCARSLPFASGSFDAAIAVEVFEHLDPATRADAIAEAARVLAPGGVLAVVDKSLHALNAKRPWLPSAFVKWIDERRGRWMYPADGPVREQWFRPGRLRKELLKSFPDVRVAHLLSPEEGRSAVFRRVPAARLMAVWIARREGGPDV